MLDITTSALRGILKFVPKFCLERYWTEKRIASGVRTIISSENDGICIDGGEVPNFYAWIEVQNLTPFEIEVDRLYGEVYCAGRIASFIWLERKRIKPLEAASIKVQSEMTNGQAVLLARTIDRDRVRLVFGGYVTCRVRGFSLIGRDITSSNVRFQNVRESTT